MGDGGGLPPPGEDGDGALEFSRWLPVVDDIRNCFVSPSPQVMKVFEVIRHLRMAG